MDNCFYFKSIDSYEIYTNMILKKTVFFLILGLNHFLHTYIIHTCRTLQQSFTSRWVRFLSPLRYKLNLTNCMLVPNNDPALRDSYQHFDRCISITTLKNIIVHLFNEKTLLNMRIFINIQFICILEEYKAGALL